MALSLATVTSTVPLQVQEDGAATAVNASRNAAYTPVTVGDRVVVEPIRPDSGHGSIIWIHGRMI